MLYFDFHVPFIADKSHVVSHLKLHLHAIKRTSSMIIILQVNKVYNTTVKHL